MLNNNSTTEAIECLLKRVSIAEEDEKNKLDMTILPLSDLKGELLSAHLSFCHDEDESVRPTWQFSTSRTSSAPTCTSGCWELLFHKVQEVSRSQFIFQKGRDFFLNTKNKLHKSHHLESIRYDACTGKKLFSLILQ